MCIFKIILVFEKTMRHYMSLKSQKWLKNVENVWKGVFKMILYFEEKNLLDIMYSTHI